MTKESAKILLPIIKAFSEGKQIQYYSVFDDKWKDVSEPDWEDTISFRIKPEPKIRPYNSAKEFLKAQKEHGPYLNASNGRLRYIHVTEVYAESIKFPNGKLKSFLQLKENYIWQDGSPCTTIEE